MPHDIPAKVEHVEIGDTVDHIEQHGVPKTLRLGTLADVDQILALSHDLFNGSPFSDLVIDDAKAKKHIEAAILNPHMWLVLVSHEGDKVVGCLIAYTFKPIYSEAKIACEVVWQLLPEYRKGRRGLDMMNAFEYWAKLMDCVICQYGWMATSPSRMEELYVKRGLKMVEKVYFKDLREDA